MTVKLTSGGSESGARPILERVGAVVEKGEVRDGEMKAGTRKAGRVVVLVLVVVKTDWRAVVGRRQHLEAAMMLLAQLLAQKDQTQWFLEI